MMAVMASPGMPKVSGDERPADGAFVGRFRRDDAFISALTKRRAGVSCGALGLIVGQKRCDVADSSRKSADKNAQQRRTQAQGQELQECGHIGNDLGKVLLGALFFEVAELH